MFGRNRLRSVYERFPTLGPLWGHTVLPDWVDFCPAGFEFDFVGLKLVWVDLGWFGISLAVF